MTSRLSDPSVVSMKSQKIMEDIAKKSAMKMYKLTGLFDDEDIRMAWNAFGLYISRQLRMGRGVIIPQFGVFSFSAPEVNLKGCTNPNIRDKQLRIPIFIVNKDFVKGLDLQSAIGTAVTIRPYAVYGSNGKIPVTKINFTEIGCYCSKSKDQTKIAVDRVIKQLSDETRTKGNVDMEIPNVGIFRVRGNLAAVTFNEFLTHDAKINTDQYKSIKDKKQSGESNLTKETITKFANIHLMNQELRYKDDNFLQIDQNTKQFLKSDLQIDIDHKFSQSLYAPRPVTSFSTRYQGLNQSQGFFNKSIHTSPKLNQLPAFKNLSMKNFDRIAKSDSQLAFRQLTAWIKTKQLSSHDAFLEFCRIAFNTEQCDSLKIYADQLYNGLEKLGLNVTPQQAQELHRILDYNKDGNIDLTDWVTVIKEETNIYVQNIKEIIQQQKLKYGELLQIMKITPEIKQIDLSTLKECLKRIDSTLTDQKAVTAAKFLMRGIELIDVAFIVDELGCEKELQFEKEELNIGKEWYQQTMLRLKTKIDMQPNKNCLLEQFQRADINNNGDISIADFKTCFLNLSLGFTINEINRLSKLVEKNQEGEIAYGKFLSELDNIKQQSSKLEGFFKDMKDFISKLQIFMKKNKADSPQLFYKRVLETLNQPEIKLQDFTTFLFEKAFQQSNEEEIQKYANELDIDRDQIITLEDLETFFGRLDYIDNNEIDKGINQKTQFNKPSLTPAHFIKESKLYPHQSLDDKQIQLILRDIKQTLYLKKMTFFELFKLLDQNQDGFITINEWQTNLDKVKKLNENAKNGLFAYMDKQKIGMIDYQSFLSVLEINVSEYVDQIQQEIETKGIKQMDDWVWCQLMIQKMKRWFKFEEITVDDAFRVIDYDFDGFIGKYDIEKFLLEVLHVSPKNITPVRITRLYKLMDQYKRGKIQLLDIKRIFNESDNDLQNFTVTGGRFFIGRDSYDWKTNAKQQIGIVLSRQFNSLNDSFENIANHSKRILYKQFENWIKNSNALIGFELSDQQIQIVFSDIDPHKKGYITLSDWILSFSGYNWLNQMLRELQDTVKLYFKDQQDAYQFFIEDSQHQFITQELFVKAVKTLFNERFTISDISALWHKLSDKQQGIIAKDNFVLIYDKPAVQPHNSKLQKILLADRPFTSPKVQNFQIDYQDLQEHKKRVAGNKNRSLGDDIADLQSLRIVKRVKQVLRSSDKTLIDVFKAFDSDNSGELSNLEFRNAFRQLNIGLTSREIDQLLDYCDESGDGKINYQEFIDHFRLADTQQRIVDRARNRLQKINDYIHYYMLSPKDAFRLFNEDRTGYIGYQDFHKFMDKLFKMANEPLPTFMLLRDLFQTIDIRKDGKIDLNEWCQTFRQFQPPNASMQGRPMMIDSTPRNQNQLKLINQTVPVEKQVEMPSHELSQQQQAQVNKFAYLIESSKKYDKIMHVIGRNRKYLLNMFSEINKKEIITYQKAQEVMQTLLKSVGLEVDEECYPLFIKFAERDGVVDYKFMLEVYKERMGRIQLQPLTQNQFPSIKN